jgi:hypothetical protein
MISLERFYGGHPARARFGALVSLGDLRILPTVVQMSADQITVCDPTRCPLCGELNRCARAADPDAKKCWCVPKTFPQNLLERVPEHAVRRACICERCLRDHPEASNE